MSPLDKFFKEGTWPEVVQWAKPVVSSIGSDEVLTPLLGDSRFLGILKGIICQAYHMNFSEDSDPFNGIGLENLRGYDPQITCHVLDALRTGRDLLGYIGRCIGSYSTSLAA